MAICDGENLGGRLASMDEGISNHAGVAGARSVVGGRRNRVIENTLRQVLLIEYPRF